MADRLSPDTIAALKRGAGPGMIFDLTDADLSGADLCGANLRDARLWRTNLRGARLRDADLSGASLIDADFSGADLTGACLAYTRREDARFDGATMPNGKPYAKRVLTDEERADLLAMAQELELEASDG